MACSAGAFIVALASPPRLDGQLVVENPSGKWRAGETVELIVRGRQAQSGSRVEEVRFDDRPIAFDLVDPGSADEVVRVRIRVPLTIKPGAHQVSVRFSEVSTAVPDIRGLAIAEARRLLEENRLYIDLGGVRTEPSDAKFLVVTAQKPRPGTRVPPGARIGVELARRSEVPEVVGLAVEEARLKLQEHALELAFAVEPLTEAEQIVTTQDPAGGAIVAAGSAVTVESEVTVPDLIGKRLEEAKPILLSAGLEFRPVFVDPGQGAYRRVVDQDPAPGRTMPQGSPIGVVFEHLADPLPPRLPWGWMALTGALSAALVQQRARFRRSLRKSYRVKANSDLEGLRASATAPAWGGRELKLDVRLLGVPDPGHQSLEIDGPLLVGTIEP